MNDLLEMPLWLTRNGGSPQSRTLRAVLTGIRRGEFLGDVEPLREAVRSGNGEILASLSSAVPTVLFQADASSSFRAMAVELPNLGAELKALRAMLASQEFVVAVFANAKGTGLCVLFLRHADHAEDDALALVRFILDAELEIRLTPGTEVPTSGFAISDDPELYLCDRVKPLPFVGAEECHVGIGDRDVMRAEAVCPVFPAVGPEQDAVSANEWKVLKLLPPKNPAGPYHLESTGQAVTTDMLERASFVWWIESFNSAVVLKDCFGRPGIRRIRPTQASLLVGGRANCG